MKGYEYSRVMESALGHISLLQTAVYQLARDLPEAQRIAAATLLQRSRSHAEEIEKLLPMVEAGMDSSEALTAAVARVEGGLYQSGGIK